MAGINYTRASRDLAIVKAWIEGTVSPIPLAAWGLWGGGTYPPKAIDIEATEAIVEQEQGKEGWTNVRPGFLTGTKMCVVTGLGYVPYGTNPQVLVDAEFLADTGRATNVKEVTEDMRLGSDIEWLIREMYSILVNPGESMRTTNLMVCRDPGMGHIAISPDGLVGDQGLLECKSSTRNAYKTVMNRWMPQIMSQMRVTRRSWCDVAMGYFPEGRATLSSNDSPKSALKVIRVYYSPTYWGTLDAASSDYIKQVYAYRQNKPWHQPKALLHASMPPVGTKIIMEIQNPVKKYWDMVTDYMIDP